MLVIEEEKNVDERYINIIKRNIDYLSSVYEDETPQKKTKK